MITGGSLISFFQSQLNQLGDLRNGWDRYSIDIERGVSWPPTRPAPTAPALPVPEDGRLGPLVAGMSLDEALATGWLGEELESCAALLGMEGVDERAFRLGQVR